MYIKKIVLITVFTFFLSVFSCSDNVLFNTSPPELIYPESIPIQTSFTEAVTYFAVHDNKLYAGTKNLSFGAEVYVFSGNNMIKVFTSPSNNYEYVSSMHSDGSHLYVGLYNETNGATLYRSNTITPTDGIGNWTLVYQNGSNQFYSIGAIAEYAGQLYIAVSSFDSGSGDKVIVLRSNDSGASFTTDISGGWLGHNNEAANFKVYNGRLYIATIKDDEYHGDGGELFFYNGTSWDAHVDSDTAGAEFAGGFGDSQNMGFPSFAVFNGYFYMGVRNQQQGANDPPLPATGCKIWRSNNMDSAAAYEEVVNNGFGTVNNISVDSMVNYGGYLYALTRNYTTGTQMWRSATGNAGTWSKRAQNGFGDSQNVSGRAVIIFNGIMYIGLETSTGGGATIIQYGAAP
jgi:hypothetical protein